MQKSRDVVILAFPDVQALDLFGPLEALSVASRLEEGTYRTRIASPDGEPFTTSSGATIVPDCALTACRGRIDTLIVAGGFGVRAACRDETLVRHVRAAAKRSRRVASVCTGAFLLASAGLLDGRRATTHWASCDELRRRHPEVQVEDDPIFVRDGAVATSAGVTAGIDLTLALIEEDLGPRIAVEVARWLVLFVRRPGGQSQFSAQLALGVAEREPIRELQEWMLDNLDADLSVAALAERAFMSQRNFARAFRREVGMTPAAYVEALRVERARVLLEGGGIAVEGVGRRCGFRTPETFRRAFRRRVRVSPGEYRDRFSTERSAA